MKQRDYRFDALRCLFMFGICLLHAFNQTDTAHWRYGAMLYFCVDGFVFISGWFGVKFGWGKVLRLCGVAFWCATVAGGANYLRGGGNGLFVEIAKCYCSYWFLHAYLFLMMIAPLIDCALASATKKELIPFFILVFGWSFLANFNGTIPYLPTTAGLGASTGLSLLGVYVVARLCKRYEVMQKMKLSTPLLIAGVLVLFLLGTTKYNLYNSPITVALTFGIFVLAMRLKWNASPIWGFLAPSMFSVYLLHTNRIVFEGIPVFSGRLEGLGIFRFFVIAISIFSVALCVDLVRRVVLRLIFSRAEVER